MLKLRITFVDDKNGNKELAEVKEIINKNFEIINISKVYKGRNNSKYSNVYIDVSGKDNNE
ncbi:hypothetical protein [uncultured Clostridium sp.]|jgi:hypothetical protein|uniref:hypothetical protein n=1 Tax=uncultured Clostridium sp. TaxID=59620 RepID=UPI0026731F9A|nr:hypothetical protein [uncultured Clostridium sp.]